MSILIYYMDTIWAEHICYVHDIIGVPEIVDVSYKIGTLLPTTKYSSFFYYQNEKH